MAQISKARTTQSCCCRRRCDLPGCHLSVGVDMASKVREVLRDLVMVVALVVPGVITLKTHVVTASKVAGTSMSPTLNPTPSPPTPPPTPSSQTPLAVGPLYASSVSDVVIVNAFAAKHGRIARGDVVTLVSPDNPDVLLVKRVVALPGDVVATRAYHLQYVRIPNGHCWLEGDNPGASHDSNSMGPVSLGLITGRAEAIIWPPSRIGLIPSAPPRLPQGGGGDGGEGGGEEEGGGPTRSSIIR